MNECENFIAQLRKDLSEVENVANAAVSIVQFVCSKKPNDLKHITYLMLLERAEASMEEMLAAIQYLSGARARILNTHFEYIEGNDRADLTRDYVAQATKTGFFESPLTGEPVKSFEEKIFLYFTPGPGATELASK